MTVSNETHEPAVGRGSGSSPGRSGLPGLALQAVAGLVIWVLVDDGAGQGWSNRNVQEWVVISLALTGVLGAISGVLTRRWRTAVAVVVGCLLATALGCALFVAYAVVSSA